jgi:hypothetical protein
MNCEQQIKWKNMAVVISSFWKITQALKELYFLGYNIMLSVIICQMIKLFITITMKTYII